MKTCKNKHVNVPQKWLTWSPVSGQIPASLPGWRPPRCLWPTCRWCSLTGCWTQPGTHKDLMNLLLQRRLQQSPMVDSLYTVRSSPSCWSGTAAGGCTGSWRRCPRSSRLLAADAPEGPRTSSSARNENQKIFYFFFLFRWRISLCQTIFSWTGLWGVKEGTVFFFFSLQFHLTFKVSLP